MRKIRTYLAIQFLLLAVTGGSLPLWAQTAPQPDYGAVRGISPSGVYAVNNLETIDPVSGNVMIRIPITAHAPVRGNFMADFSLIYNSNIFDVIPDGNGETMLALTNGDGWRYSYEYELDQEMSQGSSCPTGTPGAYPVPYYRMVLIFPDGSRHTLHLYNDSSDIGDGFSNTDGVFGVLDTLCPNSQSVNGPFTYHTSDGTFVKVIVNPSPQGINGIQWAAYFPGGKAAEGKGAWATSLIDRNGNRIYLQGFYGQTGVTTVLSDGISSSRDIQIDHEPNPQPSPFTFQDKIMQNGPGGAPLTWTVNYRSVPASSLKYPCPVADSPGGLCPVEGGNAVDSLILPAFDGSTQEFRFGYDTDSSPSGGWGQLNLIIPPTAPSTCTAAALSNCPYFSYVYEHGEGANYTGNLPGNRITQKQTNWVEDQTGAPRSDTWTYAYLTTSDVHTYYTQTVNPDGGPVNTYYFNKNYYGLGSGQCAVATGLVTKIVQPDQSTVERVWQQNLPFYPPSPQPGVTSGVCDPGNPYVSTEYRSVSNGSSAQVENAATYSYDKNGNVTEADEYGWMSYSASPSLSGSPVRKTLNTYTVATNPSTNSSDTGTAYWNPSTNPATNAPPSPLYQSPLLLDRLWRKEEDDLSGRGPGSASEFAYDANGNATDRFDWDSTKAQSMPGVGLLSSANSAWRHFVYDGNGNLTNATDPLCTTTNYTYDATYNLLLTGITQDYRPSPTTGCAPQGIALTRTTTVATDLWSGLETSRTDYNGVTRSTAYDPLGRVTGVTSSVGTQTLRSTQTHYSDGNRRVITCHDLNSAGDAALVTVQAYDQLGRINMTGQLEAGNPSGTSCVDTAPSGILTDIRYQNTQGGGYKLVSNPYRSQQSDTTMGWTLTALDRNGRTTAVTSYAGSAPPAPWGSNGNSTGFSTTAYSANSSSAIQTIADQASVSKTVNIDGLGRMMSVAQGGLTTSYTYDSADNLYQVTQGSQLRTFSHDSLERLSSASNLESGTTTYGYDSNGNLKTKITPTATVNLNYDSLSRLTGKTYSGSTNPVTYCYDGTTTAAGCAANPQAPYSLGRLTMTYNGNSTTTLQYDALGRVTQSQQQTPTGGTAYPFTYMYNLADGMTTETYPSGRVVTTTYDNAGRVNEVIPGTCCGGTYYASVANYWPNNSISSLTLGNGLVETTTLNTRFQATQLAAGSLMTLNWGYGANNNNGNVQTATITWPAGVFNQYFVYDPMNRLLAAEENPTSVPAVYQSSFTCPSATSSVSWCEQEGYDVYGNRLIGSSTNLGSPANVPAAIDPATNRNSGGLWAYDGSGNIITDGGGTQYSYDAENRQTQAGNAQYVYDGDGWRVGRTAGGGQTTYVYDAAGNLAAEYSTALQPVVGTMYVTVDNLGSTRLVTDVGGSPLECRDYLPFGEVLPVVRSNACFSSDAGVTQLFTGKERDAETGLDYFGFRYYSGAQGRWTSPDQPFADQHPKDPQSWNLYAYVRNNPLKHIDTNGRQTCALIPGVNCSGIYGIAPQPSNGRDAAVLAAMVGGPAAVALAPEAVAGAGLWATVRGGISAAITWFLGHPTQVQQATNTIADALSPPGTPSFNVAAAAENFGFKSFESMGQMVGGELQGGGSALINFTKSAENFGVNISMVSGPAGTLSRIEAGAINAATAEGASLLTLSASMVKDSMARLLQQNGFTQEIVNGQATGRWVKVINLQ